MFGRQILTYAHVHTYIHTQSDNQLLYVLKMTNYVSAVILNTIFDAIVHTVTTEIISDINIMFLDNERGRE